MSGALVDIEALAFAYDDRRVLDGIACALHAGEFVGLTGPNGSGKTTLLRLILGLLAPSGGKLHLCGAPVGSLSRNETARRAAWVPQETALEFAFTVREMVAMGRNPYLGRFRPETPADVEAIRWALRATDTERFAERHVNELSGGERQRVFLARAVAQQTPVILLDEPTANLDLAHQFEVLRLVRRLVAEGRCALAALHDLSQAARFCDRILLLSEGRIAAAGRPEEVVTEENVARYFHVRARVRKDEETGGVWVWPLESVEKTP